MTKQTTAIETITPAKAKQYLASNTVNRRIRRRWIEALASTIVGNRWHLTHQGIAFNCDGTLLDGQHRLHAIIAANKSVRMCVTRGLPRDAVLGMDQNGKRNPGDCAGPLGLEIEIKEIHSSTARAMMFGLNSQWKSPSNEEVINFIVEHIAAIEYATSLKLGDMQSAVIRGVIARAWYSCDRVRLSQFADCLRSGMVTSSQDTGAITLRNWFMKIDGGIGSCSIRRMIAAKTECALRAFLAGKSIGRASVVESEQYLLPGEAA